MTIAADTKQIFKNGYALTLWINGTPTDVLTAGEVSTVARIGILTANPLATLDINGSLKAQTLQLSTGAGLNKIPISDASGNLTLSSPSALVGITAGQVSVLTSGTTLDTDDLQDFVRHVWSTGITDGGAITTNGGAGTVDIAASDFVTRQGTLEDSPLVVYRDAGTTGLAISANDVSYVYRNYNSGTPVWQTGTALSDFNGIEKVIVYAVARNGTRMNYLDCRGFNVDYNRKARRKSVEWDGYVYSGFVRSVLGKSTVSSSGLNIQVTSGKYFWFDNPITHSAFDTTVAGAADANNFITFYNRTGTWTQVTGQKSINATQYDNAGVLTTLSNNRWRSDFLYVCLDASGAPYLALILGNVEHSSQAAAQAAGQPSALPPQFDGIAVLIAQITIQKSAATVTVINAGSTSFAGTPSSETTFSDSVFRIFDNNDATKVLALECSGITTATTRTLTVPDASGTISLIGLAETFSGVKTFADGALKLTGATSGASTLKAPAIASTYVHTLPAATDTLVGLATTDTLTNKEVDPRVVTQTDDATAVIDLAVTDQYQLTAVANATAFSTTGTVKNGRRYLIRYKDAGVAKALSWDAIFRAVGVTLPTTTVPNKTGYVLAVGNSADTKLDVLAVGVEA